MNLPSGVTVYERHDAGGYSTIIIRETMTGQLWHIETGPMDCLRWIGPAGDEWGYLLELAEVELQAANPGTTGNCQREPI